MLEMPRGQIKKRETLIKVPVLNLGLGHATRFDVNNYLNGQTLRTYDVNLDQENSVRQRSGIHPISENGAGADQIFNGSEAFSNSFDESVLNDTVDDFASAATVRINTADPTTVDRYNGRTLTFTSGPAAGQSRLVTDTTYLAPITTLVLDSPTAPAHGIGDAFVLEPIARLHDVDGTGKVARRIVHSGGGGATDAVAGFPNHDLGMDTEEPIAVHIHLSDVNLTTDIRLVLSCNGSAFVDNFALVFTTAGGAGTNGKISDHFVTGDNFKVFRKSEFLPTGNPDWTATDAIFIRFASSAEAYLIFDNCWLGPKKMDGLYNFRQSPAKGAGNFLVAAARGTICYYDAEHDRWVPLKTGLTPYMPVAFETFTEWCYWANGLDPVGVILGDGAGALTAATTFDAGIDPPDASGVTFINSAAPADPSKPGYLFLPSGIHQYRYVFYSTYTGLEGNSTLVDGPTTPVVGHQIEHSNLPVSADPKVTHLYIYRRDATSGEFRLAVMLDNGVTDWTDTVAQLDLGVELAGYPQYVRNGKPLTFSMLAGVGDRMIAAGDPAARGTVYVSAIGNAEQYDLARGPTRIDPNDNDFISAVFAAGPYACVGKQRGINVGDPIQGPSGFAFRKRTDQSGPLSHRAVVKQPDGIRYRAHDGFYHMGYSWRAVKIMRQWDTGPNAPGVVEPTFEMFDNSRAEYITGTYFKPLAQILWNDKLQREPVSNLIAVLHVGQLEGERPKGAGPAWSFHRYADGDPLSGIDVLTEYVNPVSGKLRALAGGPCGFVYDIESGEFDDHLPTGTVPIKGNALFPFMGNRGVALGQHQQKDFVYHDMVLVPLGNWNVDLEYYFDWNYKGFSAAVNTIGTDEFALAAQPFLTAFVYAEVGSYHRVELEAGRHRNVAWAIKNERAGESFHLSETTWFLEYLGAEGEI